MWGYNQLWHKQQVLTEILMQLTKQQDSFFYILNDWIQKIKKCWKTCNCSRTISLLVILMTCFFHTHVYDINTVCHPWIIWIHGVCSIKAVVDTFGGWGRSVVFYKHWRHNWFFCKKKKKYLVICLSVCLYIH